MKKSRFTVGELLVVLVAVVVVAFILFPVFAPRPDHSHQRLCASNEKQLGLAILQYQQDFDEQMPNIAAADNMDVTWRNMIYPYAESNGPYQCPSRVDQTLESDGLPKSYAANYTGNYSGAKNDWGQGAFAGPGSKPLSVNDIPAPASLIMLCEHWHIDNPEFNIDNLGAFNPHSDMLWAGHTEGSNYLFADGHVQWFKPLDTKTYWHRNSSLPLSPGAIEVLQNAHKSERD